ncbi:MAG: cyanophycinase [Deltaproteobacteria bacterium]|nr:cyanophycinase [Deltaproteobacteria bacterium]
MLCGPVSALGCKGAEDAGEDTAAPSRGVLALAGGGSEAEVGEAEAWSAQLYGGLLSAGDVTGDGLVRVVVLSASEETEWLPEYFEWLGADEALNWRLADPSSVDALLAELVEVDAVFFKGGDQSVYYELLAGGAFAETLSRRHKEERLAVGGTSAGAMILGAWALAGGRDSTSEELLADGRSSLLTDLDGGSGIKSDALGLIPGVLVETHFTERGRLGRLVACLAAAVEEGAPPSLLGFGLESQTGVLVIDGVAWVIGEGSVAVVDPIDAAHLSRESAPRSPGRAFTSTCSLKAGALIWRLGRSCSARTRRPSLGTAWPPSPAGDLTGWVVNGDQTEDEERLAWVALRAPYELTAGASPPLLPDAVAFMDAHARDYRGENQELLFRALYDLPGASGLLLGAGGTASADAESPTALRFTENAGWPSRGRGLGGERRGDHRPGPRAQALAQRRGRRQPARRRPRRAHPACARRRRGHGAGLRHGAQIVGHALSDVAAHQAHADHRLPPGGVRDDPGAAVVSAAGDKSPRLLVDAETIGEREAEPRRDAGRLVLTPLVEAAGAARRWVGRSEGLTELGALGGRRQAHPHPLGEQARLIPAQVGRRGALGGHGAALDVAWVHQLKQRVADRRLHHLQAVHRGAKEALHQGAGDGAARLAEVVKDRVGGWGGGADRHDVPADAGLGLGGAKRSVGLAEPPQAKAVCGRAHQGLHHGQERPRRDRGHGEARAWGA